MMNKKTIEHEKYVSILTGKEFDKNNIVKIINPAQASAYSVNGATLIDAYPSRHYETGKPIMIYVFERDKTEGFYDLWCKHELK